MSAFFIHTLNIWGQWSPIHLLAIYALMTLPYAVWRADRHRVRAHKFAMISLFVSALVIAGAFTFLPGRITHAVAFAN